MSFQLLFFLHVNNYITDNHSIKNKKLLENVVVFQLIDNKKAQWAF